MRFLSVYKISRSSYTFPLVIKNMHKSIIPPNPKIPRLKIWPIFYKYWNAWNLNTIKHKAFKFGICSRFSIANCWIKIETIHKLPHKLAVLFWNSVLISMYIRKTPERQQFHENRNAFIRFTIFHHKLLIC